MPRESHAEQLAAEELAKVCARSRQELRRAAQVLHDDVGSLLAVAGLRLQLLRMDFPETAARAAEVGEALEGVMEHLRKLSRALEPSPVRRTGLKNALMDLAATGVNIRLRYTATAPLPMEAADAMYHAVAGVIASAGESERVNVSVSGSRSLTARISYAGRGKPLAATELLARHSGLDFGITTKKGTIVSIRYAVRRSSGG